MKRRPPRSTPRSSSAASDVYKRQAPLQAGGERPAGYLPTAEHRVARARYPRPLDHERHQPLDGRRTPRGSHRSGADEARLLLAAPAEACLDRPAVLAQVVAVQVKTDLEPQRVAGTEPRGGGAGIDEDVVTLALPAGAYTTTRMGEATAYAVTKAFWSQKPALGERNPPWAAITPGSLAALRVKLHPGALRYYRQAGIKVPASLR